MASKLTDVSEKLESRINMTDRISKALSSESGPVHEGWVGLKGFVSRPTMKLGSLFTTAWKLAVAEPRKVVHGCKVGLALNLVALCYYFRPLYDGLGRNTVWAVMTVVFVFEFTVGATLSKAINRATGTFLGGGLAVGIHYAARSIDENLNTLIVGVSIFCFAGAATFFRFIPSVKSLFDYGFVIFVLTFSMVSVYGYRVEALYDTAYQRLGTVCIGSLVCIVINMLISPIWAGTEVHNSIVLNLDKLADSLDGCVVEFFKSEDYSTKPGNQEESRERVQGYKSALNTKATEESMVNFARWEPAHGEFGFQHPWQQYLKIGASVRNCAYYIEALNGCLNAEIQTPEHLKKPVSDACVILSAYCSDVLKELAVMMKTKTMSFKIEFLVGQMKFTVEELKDASKSIPHFLIADALSTILEAPINDDAKRDSNIPKAPIPLVMEFLPLTTLVSVLIAIVTRVERIVDAVDQLSNLANFKLPKEIATKTEAVVPRQWIRCSRIQGCNR